MTKLNLETVYSKFAERSQSVVAAINDYELINDKLAKVVCTFAKIGTNVTKDQLQKSIATLLSGRGLVVENSFREVTHNTSAQSVMVGYVYAGHQVRDYDEAIVTASMKTMANNLLMDGDESLWEIKSSPDGSKYLARHGTEDLSQLVALARVRDSNTPKIRTLSGTSTSVREFVAFIDKTLCEVRYGYVVAANENSLDIQTLEDDVQTVTNDDVIESVDLDGEDVAECSDNVSTTLSALTNPDRMKEYYKKMFSYSPEYYEKLVRIIDSHSVA